MLPTSSEDERKAWYLSPNLLGCKYISQGGVPCLRTVVPGRAGRGLFQVQTDKGMRQFPGQRQSGNQTGYLSDGYWYWQGFSSRENKYSESVVVRVT